MTDEPNGKIIITRDGVVDHQNVAHRAGTIATLPMSVCAILVGMKSGKWTGQGVTVSDALDIAADHKSTAAGSPKSVMLQHDQLPAEERNKAYYEGDPCPPNDSSMSTPTPAQSRLSRKQKRALLYTRSPMSSPNSSTTKPATTKADGGQET